MIDVKEEKYADSFQKTFGINLHPFMNPIYGFQILKFERWLNRIDDGTSIRQYVAKKYNKKAAELINDLL